MVFVQADITDLLADAIVSVFTRITLVLLQPP